MASYSHIRMHLIAKDAKAAIAFYKAAFGAEELFILTDPSDGRIGHAEMRIGESVFFVADEYPDFGALSPDTIGGSPVTFHLTSHAVDDDLAEAVAAGATVVRGPTDQSFGERNATILDPFGHCWRLSQTIDAVSPEDMQRRWEDETSA